MICGIIFIYPVHLLSDNNRSRIILFHILAETAELTIITAQITKKKLSISTLIQITKHPPLNLRTAVWLKAETNMHNHNLLMIFIHLSIVLMAFAFETKSVAWARGRSRG